MAVLPDPDSNGIGRYSESTPIPTSGSGGFSAYLNRALESVSAIIGNILAALKPYAVSFDGDGAVTRTDGVVTFSGATWVTVYGLPADCELFEIDLTSSGTASTLAVQVVTSTGSANGSSAYDKTEVLGRNGGVTGATSAGSTAWTIIGSAQTLLQLEMKIAGLRQARPTTALARAGAHSNPAVQNTSNMLESLFLSHRNSTAYYGVRINFSASQSGSIRVRTVK